jgi:hypothetical protein
MTRHNNARLPLCINKGMLVFCSKERRALTMHDLYYPTNLFSDKTRRVSDLK